MLTVARIRHSEIVGKAILLFRWTNVFVHLYRHLLSDLLPPLNLYLRQGDPYSPGTPSAGFDFRRISALPLSRRPTESVPLISSAASLVLPASFRLTDYLI